jgi:ATP-dependent Lhr-like helicase
VLGPATARQLGGQEVDSILLMLEAQGRILRGRFTPEATALEWCDRRLLARIHRYTLSRLRAEIEPVSAADFQRFLLHWQHVSTEDQLHGTEGLAAVVEQLEGFEAAAAAWESGVLPARIADYGAELLDSLCFSGRVTWGRLTPGSKAPLRSSPIALLLREHASRWGAAAADPVELGSEAAAVRDALAKKGALFFYELVTATGLVPAFVERGLAELAGAGVATADSFAGLRALLAPPDKRRKLIETAGRWSLRSPDGVEDIEAIARTLLKRYGIVFRSVLQRETRVPAWRELTQVYRRLEARGEIRGGRFVSGFGGEQFAAADAVGRLRAVRKLEKAGERVVVGAADPLNLVGILTPEARIAAIHSNRLLFEDGLAIAALEAGELRRLASSELSDEQLRALLARGSLRHPPRPHLRVATAREARELAQVLH